MAEKWTGEFQNLSSPQTPSLVGDFLSSAAAEADLYCFINESHETTGCTTYFTNVLCSSEQATHHLNWLEMFFPIQLLQKFLHVLPIMDKLSAYIRDTMIFLFVPPADGCVLRLRTDTKGLFWLNQ